ncbi:MAG: cytochrome c [Candidatus Promineifilaceae bacterium]|nr:cytochrome c [Candidatus Promineifilaceae bacterium]
MRENPKMMLAVLLLLSLLLLVACGGDDADVSVEESEVLADAAVEEVGEEVTLTGDPEAGEALYFATVIGDAAAPGCTACHSIEPTDNPLEFSPVGPNHYGLANRADDYVEGMSAEAYLLQSIVAPDAHVVEGFAPGVMYQNYDEDLTDEQIQDLVAFLLMLEGD